MVPFGQEKAEVCAVVVAVGECLGDSFPCPVDFVKTVKEKAGA